MDTSFVEEKRGVTAEWHLRQVVKWLKYDKGRQLDNVLVYASFELRCAIERCIFETLLLLNGDELTPEQQDRCRSKRGMMDLMQESDAQYRKSFEFTKIYFEVVLNSDEVKPINTAFLSRKWGELSNYCHKLLEPDKSFNSPGRKFQKKGFKLINKVLESFSTLEGYLGGYLQPASMSSNLKSVHNRYINREIDEEGLRRTLDLMAPVLRKQIINHPKVKLL